MSLCRSVGPSVQNLEKKSNSNFKLLSFHWDLGVSWGHQSDDKDEDEEDEEEVKDKDDNEEAKEDDKEEDDDTITKLSSVLPFRNHKLKPNWMMMMTKMMMKMWRSRRKRMITRRLRRTTSRRMMTITKLSSVLHFQNHKLKPNWLMMITKMRMKMWRLRRTTMIMRRTTRTRARRTTRTSEIWNQYYY